MTATKAIATVNDMAVASVENFGDTTIEGFIASRHCAKTTAKTYRNGIRQMLKYFAAKAITAPTTGDVDGFINNLRANKKSDATIRLYSATLKLFFAYLGKQGIYRDVAADIEPLRLKKAKTHKKSSLTNAQAQKLLAAVKGDSVISLRDKAIVALALQTGLRTCEISRANVGNFNDCGSYWTLDVIGKGCSSADAQIKVAPQVAEMINEYLDARGSCADDEPLFTSTSHNTGWQKNSYGARLSEQSVGKLIAKYMKVAGVKNSKTSAHSTRHYTACQALRNGISLLEIKSCLRHSSISVTTIYIEDLSVEERQAELSVASSLFCA